MTMSIVKATSNKLKFHRSSFLVASSWRPRSDVANLSRGNRACRTRTLRGNCFRGIRTI